MPTKIKHILQRLHPQRVSAQLNTFLADESISGKLILAATVLALIVVNSSLAESYSRFWATPLSIGIGTSSLTLDLRHWVNEGLMAFFFLVVGLEIKRELVKGELKDMRAALLPIGAAVGGMVAPAIIYLFFNTGTEAARGWGIPIATDIAFAVAVLSLLSRHVPVALKVFLLTLAIADDIGAITVIALFYAEIIHYGFLAASGVIILAIFLFRKFLTGQLALVLALGITLWLTTHLSGIHASIVGALMGLLAPIPARGHRRSVAERAEQFFLPLTTFFVLPVFAFANAGFVLSRSAFDMHQNVMWGIMLGLVLGKFIGIFLASWLLVKGQFASLPASVSWRHIVGVSFIAGIGFTVSIFITELAFAGNESLINAAKLSIFLASIASALIGSIILVKTSKQSGV